jgi:hypothetical protein
MRWALVGADCATVGRQMRDYHGKTIAKRIAGITFDTGTWIERRRFLPTKVRVWVFVHITAPAMDRLTLWPEA